MGIEGSSEKVRLAKTLQEKFPESKGFIKYFEHFITIESEEQIKEAVKDFQTNRICITGLHACADLSVIMLELFTKLEMAKSLVIMPCCYHRMNQVDGNFENFPASNLVKELIDLHGMRNILNVPFLRLACQNSVDGFKNLTAQQHEEHANNGLFRAILQDVADSG